MTKLKNISRRVMTGIQYEIVFFVCRLTQTVEGLRDGCVLTVNIIFLVMHFRLHVPHWIPRWMKQREELVVEFIQYLLGNIAIQVPYRSNVWIVLRYRFDPTQSVLTIEFGLVIITHPRLPQCDLHKRAAITYRKPQ